MEYKWTIKKHVTNLKDNTYFYGAYENIMWTPTIHQMLQISNLWISKSTLCIRNYLLNNYKDSHATSNCLQPILGHGGLDLSNINIDLNPFNNYPI